VQHQPPGGGLVAAPILQQDHRRPARSRAAGHGTPPQVIAAIDELLDHHTHAEIARILNQRGLASGEGRPFHPLIIRNIRDNYQLRSRYQRLRDVGMLTLAELAAQLRP
jgi:hypothetical protein